MAPSLPSLLLAVAALIGRSQAAAQPPPSSTEVDPGASATAGGWQVLSSNSGVFAAVNSSYAVRYAPSHTRCSCRYCSRAATDLMNGSAPALGNTRFNISVTVTSARSPTLPPLVAHVHAARCSAAPPGGGHYLYNASLPDDALAAAWSTVPAYGTNTLSALLVFRNATFSTTTSGQPWLANFDGALSVVIHDPAGRIACMNLVPALPNLPAEYSVTMEANFGFGKAYTMVIKEFASTALGKRAIVMHTNTTSQAQVQDLSGNMTYTLVQNATFPDGPCTATPCIGTPLQPCSGSLSGLSTYYSLGSGDPIGFDGMNVQNVRGITCERWSRPFTMALGRGPPTNATAYFYFPTATWSNRASRTTAC